jgi:hypothetical protein
MPVNRSLYRHQRRGYGAGFKGDQAADLAEETAAKKRESRLNSPFVMLPTFAGSGLDALHAVC